MAVDRFAGATCCARWMLFIALCACNGAATTPNPNVGAPAGVGGVPAASFGKWPMMGYDPNNNYHNTTETIMSVATAPMLKEKWRTTIAGNPPGTPIIADGRVFVLATGGTYALSLADGKILW